jgi:hypothetical protein
MKEFTQEEQAERAMNIKDVKSTPGWSVIEGIIKDMEEEAFDQFSELPMDAPQEKVLKCKSTKLVLKELRNRIQQEIDLGKESIEFLEKRKQEEISEIMFQSQYDSSSEIDKLSKPLQWLINMVKPDLSDNHMDNQMNNQMARHERPTEVDNLKR